MMKIVLIPLLFLTGCSFKTPQNEWQYKGASSFSSYTKNFLSANDSLAENDLNRAVKHAKQSADLTQLATIYLGECSLNLSVGIKDNCEKYTDIAELVNSKELDAYFHLITKSITVGEIKHLPKRYQTFAQNLSQKNFTKANDAIRKMETLSSSLIAASVLEDDIELITIKHLIDKSSFHGYKKAVLFWLKESLEYIENEEEREQQIKILKILKSHK